MSAREKAELHKQVAYNERGKSEVAVEGSATMRRCANRCALSRRSVIYVRIAKW